MLFVALAAALVPGFAAAQQVFTVQVASGGLNFSPNNINNVSKGDTIQFVFDAAGHTVTQSTLANPCTALDGGFSSGFSTGAGEVWNLTVSDTSKPLWYFCAQTTPLIHCQKGMVGAINSPSDTFNTFSAAATAATNTPSGSAVVLSGSGAAATASITSASAVASATSPSGSSGSSGSSTTSSGSASTSSSAAKPFAGFEGLGATFLALFGAILF